MSVALGLVGFGIMGERLLRAALAHDPSVIRPVAVWDPSPAAAARLKEIAPGLSMLGSAAEVIAACDVLYIASPPSSHIAHADAAFAAGRAAFLEKPLASDLQDARRFVAAAVNFPMAASPAVAQLSAWRVIAHELVASIRGSVSVDWVHREAARARHPCAREAHPSEVRLSSGPAGRGRPDGSAAGRGAVSGVGGLIGGPMRWLQPRQLLPLPRPL